MLDKLEWPSLEARKERSSLIFYKIYSRTVFLEKYEYLTLAPSLKRTNMASHDSQYAKYLAYSGALKTSFFFPRAILMWNSIITREMNLDTQG